MRFPRGLATAALLFIVGSATADVRYTLPLLDRKLLAQDEAFTVAGPVPPSTRIVLRYDVSGECVVTTLLPDGKPLPSVVVKGDDVRTVLASTPAGHPYGGKLSFRFKAVNGPAEPRNVRLIIELPDANKNGIGDPVEKLLSPGGKARVIPIPRPDIPRTTFQTGEPYSPQIAVPADTVLVYSSDSAVIKSWADRGYNVRAMGGFRAGADYARERPEEVQIDRDGRPQEIGGQSYYLVPTLNRVEAAQQYFDAALKAGANGICPEEPEYWSRAGYSEAFKQEWQRRYNAPWVPPHTSVDTRWKSEQLKAFLERRQIEAILARARDVRPDATRMLAIHSPINYPHWGIVSPHYDLFQLPMLQEVIGQVWTGTARTATRLSGVRAERTFDLAMLEYGSLYHLARGTDKRLWFLVDPVEDTPGLPPEDYRRNFHQTLVAALMNPDVDRYEVMPWPQRIYGQVSEEYAAEVNSVVGALTEMWRYPAGRLDAGSRGIATVVADSMGWQRADPYQSDLEGFYGLTLPFVTNGVPIDVLSLDRVGESNYLSETRVLMLSYDFLKPRGPEVHAALADWVKNGGVLALFGGSDPYSGVSDAWWKSAGFDSPTDHLLNQFGLAVKTSKTLTPAANSAPWTALLAGDPAERALKNRKRHVLDLSPFVKENGSVTVRFEDVSPLDGWGPYVAAGEIRVNGKLGAAFRAGSELESRFLEEDRGSRYNGDARFADGPSFWTYRFDNLPRDAAVTLTLDMGNGFKVSARPARPYPVLQAAGTSVPSQFARIQIPHSYPITLIPPSPGATALFNLGGEPVPPVWEAPVGKGAVLYCGVAPGYLSANATGSRWIRWIGERSLEKTGSRYEEQEYFRVTRGPYSAVRTMARPITLNGSFINLFDPTLPLLEAPVIPPRSWGLFQSAGAVSGGPRLLALSGRQRARAESATETSWLVEAPTGSAGAARVWAGERKAAFVRASTVFGQPVAATATANGDTVLIRYPNDADGVVVRVVWQ